ncbi:MAG: glycosyltransferase family 4 protein [Prevotella sp.]|nr:glycosyltransferase family 4 protein [Prevotella sp.]
MKVLFVTPGSGDGYFCGNCYRDNLMAQALHRAGHEVTVMPLYLPLNHIGDLQGTAPLFFPATTYYVEQKTGRRSPRWMRKLFDSKAALSMAASFAGTTTAEGMEDMTFSMIEGTDPTFLRHINELIGWIRQEGHPDIIHLSSSLLIGIAKHINEQLHIPIVCSLQDEEVWIDTLAPEYAQRAWQGISHGAKWIDQFVTTSHYYEKEIHRRLPSFPAVEVIYPGVEITRYQTDVWPSNPTIGFFYRMNELDGLDILTDAFVILKERNNIPNLKLLIGGGYMSTDKGFLSKVRQTLRPYIKDVTIEEDYSWKRHADFYRAISVLAVPLRFQEGIGLYLCEAFAAGRPAVEPQTGSFPEIIGEAGITYQPNTATALAEALEQLLTNDKLLASCSSRALHLSKTRYNDELTAQQLLKTYNAILERGKNRLQI